MAPSANSRYPRSDAVAEGMQEERSVANGTAKRQPSGPVACGEIKNSSQVRGELPSRGRGGRSPSGNLDLGGFEDPN